MEIKIYSVSEINNYIKQLFDGDLNLSNVAVAGEISNFTHHRSGHMYFTLKDEKSSLRSVFFKGSNMSCKFLPANGMGVWAVGRISVYEVSGQYQLYVEELEPAGVGALYLAFEQLKNKLKQEGLFQDSYKKELPVFPHKVALVTSPTGAALQDILSTSGKRFAPVEFLVVETLMQGIKAPGDIIASINYLNRCTDIDVIVLARGGGSLEDLWAFNDESVARAIFTSDIPVISAIGHETDYTISDFVADCRAPTPTAAATILFPLKADLVRHIDHCKERLGLALKNKVEKEKQILTYLFREKLLRLLPGFIEDGRDKFLTLEREYKQLTINILREKGYSLNNADTRLEGLSPFKIMQRGYSFCRDENGKVVTSVEQLICGQRLQLGFKDGKAWSRLEEIEKSVDKTVL